MEVVDGAPGEICGVTWESEKHCMLCVGYMLTSLINYLFVCCVHH